MILGYVAERAVSAQSIAIQVNRREVSALGLASQMIEAVKRLNPQLNAIVQFDPAQVLKDALDIDKRLDSGEKLPMAGVLFTVKDNLWVAGRRVSQGSKLFQNFIAPKDAWVVARLKALGAVMLGITNCSEFACKGVTDNLLYGQTSHPLDHSLTPGGSSGGAASALAAGLGHIALGTDAGGSTRRPAAHCGLVGLKPSVGLIPHPWGFAEPIYGQSVIGIFATSVADCAWVYDHLQAFDANDPAGVPIDVGLKAGPLLNAGPAQTLRIAWSPQLGCDFAIDSDVLSALQASVDRIKQAGVAVSLANPIWPAGVKEYPLLDTQLAGLHALYGSRSKHEKEKIDPQLVAQIEAGAQISTGQLAQALRLREQIVASLSRFFDQYDVLLCPTAPVTAWSKELLAPTHIGGVAVGSRAHGAFTPLFNACGVPACSIPVATVNDLPVGLQVIAPKYEDARVLQFAHWVEGLKR